MNKLSLILFLFFLGFTASEAHSAVPRKLTCEHFHFSNASHLPIIFQANPTLSEKTVFDVPDDDPGSKNNTKCARPIINTSIKTCYDKNLSARPTLVKLSTNKSEYNPVLRI